MNTTLTLSQRLWLIDAIGSLASTTALIKVADGFIGLLAPTAEELSVEGLDFKVEESGLTWNTEVEAKLLKPLEVQIDSLIYSKLKEKYAEQMKDPTGLDLEMISLLSL